MTTIAYKDGILVGDSLVCYETGSMTYRIEYIDKVIKRQLGSRAYYYAESGDMQEASIVEAAFDRYFTSGVYKDPCPDDETNFVVVMNGVLYDAYTNIGKSHAKFRAIGSGQTFAVGAMQAGATALEAVAAAIELDVYSGYPIVGYNTKTGEGFRFENKEEYTRSQTRSNVPEDDLCPPQQEPQIHSA